MNSHVHYLKVSFTVAAPSPCCINLHILHSGQKKDNNHLLLTVELICLIWSPSLTTLTRRIATDRKHLQLDVTNEKQ